MSPLTRTARTLLERTGSHPVVSLYFSLDPTEFATAPARESQINSLLDEADRLAKPLEEGLDHDATMTLRADLERVRDYLLGDDMPVTDVRATAIFASGADDLFHTVSLATDAGPSVAISEHPVIEPLVVAPAAWAWCAVLPSMDRADIYLGSGEQVRAHQHDSEYVRGRSAQGGSSGHDEEQDAENHLISVSRRLQEDFDEGRFSALAVGGPVEARTHFEKLLSDEVRGVLLPDRLDVDPSAAGPPEIAAATAALVAGAQARAQGELLAELTAGLGEAKGSDRPARAVLGIEDVQTALTEARVGTLLLADQFSGPEREAMIRAAVGLDADVVAFSDEVSELGPGRPVAALLRF